MSNSKTLRVQIKPGTTWANITSDVYTGITIKRGQPDEAPGLTAASATLALKNAAGTYTPANPSGAYYPNLTKATPVTIGMGVPPAGAGAKVVFAASATSPTVVAEASGAVLAGWSQWGTSGVLTGPSGYTMASTGNVGSRSQLYTGAKFVSAGTITGSAMTSTGSSSWGSAAVFVPGGSSAVQLTATGGKVFGSLTGQQSDYVSAGTAVSWSAGDTIVMFMSVSDDSGNRMHAAPGDDTGACEWVLAADSGPGPGPRVQAWTKYMTVAGSTSKLYAVPIQYDFQDVLFQAWKVVGSTQWNPRFAGSLSQLSSVPTDQSGRDVRCNVTAGSVLRRQANQGTQSALRRYYLAAPRATAVGGLGCSVQGAYSATGLLAYWPLEGDGGAVASPSPIPGVQAAAPTGSVVFGADPSIPASDTLPQLNNGAYLTFPVPAYSTGANVAGQMAGTFKSYNVAYTAFPPQVTFMYAQLSGPGTTQYIAVQGNSTGLQLTLFDGTRTATLVSPFFRFFNPLTITDTTKVPEFTVVTSWQPDVGNAANTDLHVMALDNAGILQGTFSTTLTGNVMGPVTQIVCGLDPTGVEYFTSPLTVGHVYFGTNTDWGSGSLPNAGFPGYSAVFPNLPGNACANVFGGWAGENPIQRMIRVSAEQGIPFQSDPFGYDPTAILCGVQPPAAFAQILQDAADTDGGQLGEARGFAGLTYRKLNGLASKAAKETFDMTPSVQAVVGFQSVDDDQQAANLVTATNAAGGSAIAFTQAVDVFPQSVTATVQNTTRDLPYVAQWWLNVGTPTGPRYKSITVNLATYTGSTGATSVDAVTAVDIGHRVTLTNTPVWAQPGPADVLVTGLVETIGSTPGAEWTIELDGGSYSPYTVFILDDSTYGTLDTVNRLGLGT